VWHKYYNSYLVYYNDDPSQVKLVSRLQVELSPTWRTTCQSLPPTPAHISTSNQTFDDVNGDDYRLDSLHVAAFIKIVFSCCCCYYCGDTGVCLRNVMYRQSDHRNARKWDLGQWYAVP